MNFFLVMLANKSRQNEEVNNEINIKFYLNNT